MFVQYIGKLHLDKAECCSLYIHAELEHRVVHVKETSFIPDDPGPIRKHEVLWKMQEKYQYQQGLNTSTVAELWSLKEEFIKCDRHDVSVFMCNRWSQR